MINGISEMIILKMSDSGLPGETPSYLSLTELAEFAGVYRNDLLDQMRNNSNPEHFNYRRLPGTLEAYMVDMLGSDDNWIPGIFRVFVDAYGRKTND